MTDRHDIVLSEHHDAGNGRSGILDEIKAAIEELFPTSVSAAGNYIAGKGQQELAKANAIKVEIVEKIGRLENERSALIQRRDQQSRELQCAHRERMYELRTQRLKEVVDRLIRLRDLGVEVELDIVAERLMETLRSDP